MVIVRAAANHTHDNSSTTLKIAMKIHILGSWKPPTNNNKWSPDAHMAIGKWPKGTQFRKSVQIC